MTGYSVAIIPLSWTFGRKNIRQKTVYALGPFRFSIHRGLGRWKDQ